MPGRRVRPLLVPEELALDELARDRGAVHRHELARAPRQRVYRTGEDLLADAGLPSSRISESERARRRSLAVVSASAGDSVGIGVSGAAASSLTAASSADV